MCSLNPVDRRTVWHESRVDSPTHRTGPPKSRRVHQLAHRLGRRAPTRPLPPCLGLPCVVPCIALPLRALPCLVTCPALPWLALRPDAFPCLAHAIFKKLSSDHLYTLSDSRLVFLPGATLPCLLPCPALPPGALPWLLVPCPDLPPRTLPWLAARRLPLSCLAQDVFKKLSCDHLHSLSGD
jgi:hypothetical protein